MKNYLKKGTLPIDIAIVLVAIASWLSITFPSHILVITSIAGLITIAGCGVTIFLSKHDSIVKEELFDRPEIRVGNDIQSEVINRFIPEMHHSPLIVSGDRKTRGYKSIQSKQSLKKRNPMSRELELIRGKVFVPEHSDLVSYEATYLEADLHENDPWVTHIKLVH